MGASSGCVGTVETQARLEMDVKCHVVDDAFDANMRGGPHSRPITFFNPFPIHSHVWHGCSLTWRSCSLVAGSGSRPDQEMPVAAASVVLLSQHQNRSSAHSGAKVKVDQRPQKTTYVPRGEPGRINGMGPPDPTHVYIAAISHRTNALVELEVHQSVEWEFRVGSFHELDVCIMNLKRSNERRDQLRQARRLLGVECKQCAWPADLGVGRQSIAFRSLPPARRQAIVATGTTNKSLEKFVTALGTRHSYYA